MLSKFRFFRNFQIIILFVLLLFTFHSQLLARAGDLDPTFDGDGILTRQFETTFNLAPQTATAIQPDGKIIFASTAWISFPTGSGDGYTVIRYNPNGSLDTTFGTNGVVNTNVGNFEGVVNILLQPDGKIILSGERYSGNTRTDFALIRYNADGSLDNSFDGNGLAVATFTNFSEERWGAAALQSDGKIVVAGQTDNETENASFDWAVVRFNTDGSLDTTFDGDGRTSFSLGGDMELASSVAIQQDGKIIVSGTSNNGSNNDFTTVRLNSNGSRDQSFGVDGLVRTQFGSGNESAYSVKIQNDNKIVVAGGTFNGANTDIALVRYNTNGSPDPSFGTNGLVTASYTQTSDESTYSLVIQQDGKLVVSSSFGANAGVIRFNGNGTLDNSFGNGGKVSNVILNFTFPIAYSTAIQNDGKIVISGSAYWQGSGGPSYYFLARYNGASANKSPFDFDGDGKTDIGIFRPSVGEWWINRSSSGQTVAAQFGSSTDQPTPADFTGDGKADIAFWRPS
ncbi:MAG TPA: FG-GAP-like repeat-containing protein, partial [Pyrinomonadaceae bacterium]|nr:FG-GAP-like repeat-containing protein [Pyrinomonadaceae bacterium]